MYPLHCTMQCTLYVVHCTHCALCNFFHFLPGEQCDSLCNMARVHLVWESRSVRSLCVFCKKCTAVSTAMHVAMAGVQLGWDTRSVRSLCVCASHCSAHCTWGGTPDQFDHRENASAFDGAVCSCALLLTISLSIASCCNARSTASGALSIECLCSGGEPTMQDSDGAEALMRKASVVVEVAIWPV